MNDFIAIIFLGTVVTVLSFGILFLARGLANSPQQIKNLWNKKRTTVLPAKVTEVQESVDEDDFTPHFRLLCSYHDAQTGQEHLFKSDKMIGFPEVKVGEACVVRAEPGNMKNYVVLPISYAEYEKQESGTEQTDGASERAEAGGFSGEKDGEKKAWRPADAKPARGRRYQREKLTGSRLYTFNRRFFWWVLGFLIFDFIYIQYPWLECVFCFGNYEVVEAEVIEIRAVGSGRGWSVFTFLKVDENKTIRLYTDLRDKGSTQVKLGVTEAGAYVRLKPVLPYPDYRSLALCMFAFYVVWYGIYLRRNYEAYRQERLDLIEKWKKSAQ